MRNAQRGTDFCDHCVVKLNRIKQAEDDEKGALTEELSSQEKIAETEYESYCNVRLSVDLSPCREVVHFIFDFAGKVTLPSMERQPSQLHFILA